MYRSHYRKLAHHRELGQFDSSSRALGRKRWAPQPYRRRLVKAKQRIAHPLPRRIVRDANDAHKVKSQRVGHPEMCQPVKDAPPAKAEENVPNPKLFQ